MEAKRIAYCSPLNPQPSGISDYSEELLPYLSQYAEITVFVSRGVEPSNSRIRRHLAVQPLERLPRLHAERAYDAILYHMGNSPVHAEIYEAARKIPGVVVIHDLVLHHFKLWYAAARRGEIGEYLQEMRRCYGERGAAVASRMARGQLLDVAFTMPLVEDLIEGARGIIGHSRFVTERVRAMRADVPVAHVPMGVPLPPLVSQADARASLGLPAGVPLWASFGHINPYKRMEPALRAFRRFRTLEPEARYLLVGSVSPSYDLAGVIRRLGLQDAVMVTGYVPPAAFTRYVAASDLCLNLRYPTAGETSASVLRLLGAARPTLVSAIDALAELPDDVCAKVDLGAAEGDQILAYARLLFLRPELAADLGRSARRFVAGQHSLDGAARGFMDFLADVYGWETPARQRPPLWEDAPKALTPSPSPRRGEGSEDELVPPLPAWERGRGGEGLQTTLTRDAGAALAELGVEPSDHAILEDTAGIIAELAQSPLRGRRKREP